MSTDKSKLEIRKLKRDSIDDFAVLMDAYRVFYGRQSNLAQSKAYVKTLFEKDNVIFLMAVLEGKELIGFCTLLQSYSSVRAGQIYILNDLYVDETHRRCGCAVQLLRHAESLARANGMAFVKLETAQDNHIAQAVYRKLGWKPSGFVPYIRDVS